MVFVDRLCGNVHSVVVHIIMISMNPVMMTVAGAWKNSFTLNYMNTDHIPGLLAD